jgi:hypothetical protein
MVLWVFLAIAHPIAIAMSYSLLLEMLGSRTAKPVQEHIFSISFFTIYISVFTIWKMATFRRSNMIKLLERMGVKFINKTYFYSFIDVFGVYSFTRAYWNDIFVAAKMDIPFFAYAGHRRVKLAKLKGSIEYSGGDTPDYMKEESSVDLFSLIQGPYDVNVSIKLDDGKRNIPVTDVSEIDVVLKTHLKDVQQFNARLIFNKDCLRMSIIGGSWEGKRFGEKIQKGFEMFKLMSDALKTRYPVASWSKYQVKWNRAEETFYLAG